MNVMKNTKCFRSEMEKIEFDLVEKERAIIPVMLYDTILSQKVAEKILKKDIYVTFFLSSRSQRQGVYPHANVVGYSKRISINMCRRLSNVKKN